MEYQLILIPLLVAVLTQILKLSIDKIQGNLNLKNIFISYGGMPSAHTAFAVSVTTMAGIWEGFTSAIFASSLVFTLIIMRDAVTFRNILGNQGKLLNTLVQKLPRAQQKGMPHFLERVGHSASEVGVGTILGIILTSLLSFLFNS